MNLAFSEDDEALRDELAKLLAADSARDSLTRIERDGTPCDTALWRALAETGWLAAAVPERHGGSALGATALCVLAEEVGRASPAVPYVASVCGFAAGLALADAPALQADWLPRIADGSAIGVLLQPEDWHGAPAFDTGSHRLSGATGYVRDGAAATVALAFVGDGASASVVLLPLSEKELATGVTETLDLLHPPAALRFDGVAASVVAEGDAAHALWRQLRDRYALFTAFEQLGGAQAALAMARDYSLSRYAFGRPIGSFQALKHSMADMLAAVELARSNCCYGAAALNREDARLAEAVAVARISATEAYRLCARQNLQIHGGIGVTWESDAHFHYRRAQSLAMAPGSPAYWKEHLVSLLLQRSTAD